jgi:Ca2+-binding RTX toxin-like protein
VADIFGTNAADTLKGTIGDDRIYGLDDNDNLKGGTGNDELFGGAGNDSLHGEAGADTTYGGAGDDTYYVDNIGDIVSEQTVAGVDDGGTDRVYTTVSYTLGAFLERATLIGTVAGDLTGNDQANTLTGNDAANALSGGGGSDTLNAAGGTDRLIGGAGKDTLTGGAGSDTFVFGPADATSTDKVTDFAAEDFVGVLASDYGLALGSGLIDNGSGTLILDPSYFATITGSTNVQGTALGHGQFLFNSTTRTLLWDADGAGSGSAGVALATFNADAVLSAASFAVMGAASPVGNISISDVTISEGDAGTQTATFTVSRTGTAAFAVDFSTADGTATAGSDYLAKSGTLDFAAGQASQTVSVTINGDTTFESNETFFVNLTNATNGGTIFDGQGIGTITNNDAAPPVGNISISDVTISEGDAGTQTATFTVSRTGTAAFAVDFSTADGTATAGSDYLAKSGTLDFAAGQASQTVSVTINGDTTFESNETFFVNLTNATNGGTIFDGQGIGTITNNDAAPLVGDIIGTAAGEDLTGNSGSNRIFGFDGKDRLYAMAGTDLLYAGTGNDLLDGGTGADNMFGGSGDDVYRVDNIGDVVSEESAGPGFDDGGSDSVESSITYSLRAFLEKLTLTGIAAINGIGNSLANTIRGNDTANVLSGMLGADDLRGNGGDDTLVGGAGKDTLAGGTGADTFVLGGADATSTDKIVDFDVGVDRIRFFAKDYGLVEGQGLIGGALDPSYFAQVSGTQNQGTVSGHGQFLYNTTTSSLMWDADGAAMGAAGVALATFSLVNNLPVDLTAANLVVTTDLPTVSVVNPTPDPQTEGNQAYFVLSLSAPTSQDVYLHYATADGTATSGNDFVGTSDSIAFIPAGSISTVVGISLLPDSVAERTSESFSLQLISAMLADGTSLGVGSTPAIGYIDDEPPQVVNIIDTRSIGSVDPSGLAYVPGLGLFLSDSEVDETPFSRPNNLFQLQTDGTDAFQFNLLSFTHEPTGLTFDSMTNRLYMTDDDQFKFFWVDPSNPTVKLGEFNTPIAADDPEDIAIDPKTGNLFIVNGLSHSIVEVDPNTGLQVGTTINLPSTITDPEALVYDAQNDVFYVGGGFSSNIWCVDRSGNILDTIYILDGFPNPVTGNRVHVKDMEFAPTSDPYDDPSLQSLYVVDSGNTHETAALSDDGRLFEVDLGNQAPLDDFLV